MDIKKDIEFIENQVNYLDNYHANIVSEWKKAKSIKVKWNGLEDDHLIYLQLQRWVKCYEFVKEQLQKKSFSDEEISKTIAELPNFSYPKVSLFKDENISNSNRIIVSIIFPLRFYKVGKKIDQLEQFIKSIGNQVYYLKKLRYKIEGYYYDGI